MPDLARQILSVLLVFALLGLAIWKLRRGSGAFNWKTAWRRPGAAPRSLESLERLAITPQHSLHLIRVQGREILIATHPQGCSFLNQSGLSETGLSETGKGAGA